MLEAGLALVPELGWSTEALAAGNDSVPTGRGGGLPGRGHVVMVNYVTRCLSKPSLLHLKVYFQRQCGISE